MKRNFFYSFSRNLYERVKESKNNSTVELGDKELFGHPEIVP